ncbi:MAG TPA: T9SS type A sorting domain-containing protein [bacterium]|nr:T9SS type A sorting domain-containing protein [bacterium]HPN46096.1 T9SS type A sorting domain-containing protein [bacterium]
MRNILFFLVIILGAQLLFAQSITLNKRIMTDQEFNRIKAKIGVYQDGKNYNIKVNGHGTGLKPPTEAEWQQVRNLPILVDKINKIGGGLKAAPNHDNSATNWFPPIGNQDGEGSCVAWAEGYYVKTFQEAREHNWNLSGARWEGGYDGEPSSAYQNKIFSPDFIYHQINDGVDEGAYFSDAIDLLYTIGCCTWDLMPFDPRNSTTWPDESAWRQAPLYRSDSGYSYMWVTEAANLVELKTIIENYNCVTIPVNADEYEDMTSNDLWTWNNYSGSETNHANTIVGYDDNYGPYSESGSSNNYGAFKIANSWGEGSWENDADGFYYISYKAMMERVQVIFVYENRVNYQPQLLAVFNVSHNNRSDCNITLGIGETSSPTRTKKMDDFISQGGPRPYPANNMALDITEFVPYMNNTADKFFLNVYDGSKSTTGEIISFSVEKYTNYQSGSPVNTWYSSSTPVDTRNNSNNYATILTSDIAAVIQVSPAQQNVSNSAGDLTLTITCNGADDMPWTAGVTSGSTWLSITSATSGNGNGTINAHYLANPNSSPRTGVIQITAAWASNSPQQSQITQAAADNSTITVTTPNGGENWQTGSNQRITWNSSGAGSTVNIDYSINNGTDWLRIFTAISNDGSHSWTIPNTPSSMCLVRIADTDGNPVDQSNNVFTIYGTTANITLTSPNGGENWLAGSSHNITWTSSNISSTVNIDYSTNNGSTWSAIIANTSNDGSHPWTIPNVPSTLCLVRIADADGSPVDQSNSVFSILPAIQHFSWTETEDYYPVLLYAVTLDDIPVNPGDEIGIFTSNGFGGEICAGAVVIYGNPPYSIMSWGDDSQTDVKDGFASGEALHFRLWDSSTNTEYAPESGANYTSGNGEWGNGPMAQINPLEFRTACTYSLTLASGWNWISANVIPENPSMSSTWASVQGVTIVKGINGFYVPGTINSIGDWNVLQMYQVNMQSAQQLSFAGECVAANTPITLAAGWNWVSFLPNDPMNAEIALAGIDAQLGIAKGRNGFYIPGKMNSIGDMAPGAGYKLYMNQAATLIYPAPLSIQNSPGMALAKTISAPGAHFRIDQTGPDYHAIIINSIQGTDITPGAEIAVFTDANTCIGSTLYNGRFPLAILAWTDEQQTDDKNAVLVEKLSFKLWDPANNNEFSLQSTTIQGSDTFNDDAFSEIILNLASMENIPADLSLAPNYPNPFNPVTTIRYGLPAADVVTLQIFDVLGREMLTLIDAEKQPAGWHSCTFDASRFASGLYFCRLQTPHQTLWGKMTLVK